MPLLCLSSDIVANTCTDLSCRINHFTGLFLFWQSRSLNQDELCKICFLWCCCKMHGTYLQYICIDLSLMYAWNIDLFDCHNMGEAMSSRLQELNVFCVKCIVRQLWKILIKYDCCMATFLRNSVIGTVVFLCFIKGG